MKKLFLIAGLALLSNCQKQEPIISPNSLLGEWHLQTYDFSSYSGTGVLLSHLVSPGGDTENIIITDSTVAYFSNVSNSPGPPTPGRWVARKYTRLGDTLRYDKYGRRDIIVTLTSNDLTLHTSSKQTIPSYYQESDSYYTRVR